MIKQEPDFAGGVSVFIKWVLLAQRTRTQMTLHPKSHVTFSSLYSNDWQEQEFHLEHWHWQEVHDNLNDLLIMAQSTSTYMRSLRSLVPPHSKGQ